MGGNPSVPVLHKFLHMLDISERDLSEEMELQLAKARVVATIRHNQELEKEALDMDVRIGLLVRNCITLEDVVKGHGGGKREKTALAAVKSDWLHSSGGGLTALSRRKSREAGGVPAPLLPAPGISISRQLLFLTLCDRNTLQERRL
ncbi:hypothetical protein HPB48_023377 [Haemaphysalis longicornis]|uniref:Uncharacterized protein n=1 Tax=Haemaphysalis longicornis TaxID=44386 RepID=A0A9J6GWG1_HAELO|nr:hypothetical protein HPB48_023377 [Haemaphysalis longicornis]